MDIHTPLDPKQFGHLCVSTMMRTQAPRFCILPHCDGEVRSMGLCAAHYQRSRTGMPVDVMIVRRKRLS